MREMYNTFIRPFRRLSVRYQSKDFSNKKQNMQIIKKRLMNAIALENKTPIYQKMENIKSKTFVTYLKVLISIIYKELQNIIKKINDPKVGKRFEKASYRKKKGL